MIEIDEFLAHFKRCGIRPEGVFEVYAEVKAEHPDWPDSEVREAAEPVARRRASDHLRDRLRICACGHRYCEHAGRGQWCQIGDCECTAFATPDQGGSHSPDGEGES